MGFRVSSDEDLEATVKKKAVDEVGADAAADAVGCFEKKERDVTRVEVEGGG